MASVFGAVTESASPPRCQIAVPTSKGRHSRYLNSRTVTVSISAETSFTSTETATMIAISPIATLTPTGRLTWPSSAAFPTAPLTAMFLATRPASAYSSISRCSRCLSVMVMPRPGRLSSSCRKPSSSASGSPSKM